MSQHPEQQNVRLSVVIAAWNGEAMLSQCLASLNGQTDPADTEIIVASNFAEGTELLRENFPHLRYLSLPAGTTVPELRAAGIRCSRGEVVALLEDNCSVDPNWSSEIRRAHESPYAIVGGSVENVSFDTALDWAVYFYDYGKYMIPNQAGEVSTLSGNNVSYKRSVLESVQDRFREGFFETFIHEELKRQGHKLYLLPSAIVYHQKSYEARNALADCYHHARTYAGQRISRAPLGKRLVFISGSLILPILLPARIASTTIKKGRHLKELLRSFPHLVLLMSSWSLGEFCGYLCGEGASARMWR